MSTKIKYLFFFLLACTTYACTNNKKPFSTAEELARDVTIYRDIYGIPHVNGSTNESVLFGFAYARAEDRFKKIEMQYIKSIARLAEMNGGFGTF